MRITAEELNNAYYKVNELKVNGIPIYDNIEIDIERNPLIDEGFFDDKSDYIIPFKLLFSIDKTLGPRGSYVLTTDVDIIGDEGNEDELYEE